MGTAKMQSERMILPWSKSIVLVINPPRFRICQQDGRYCSLS